MPEAAVVSVVDCTPEDAERLQRLRSQVSVRVSLGAPEGACDLVARAAESAVLVTLYTYTRVNAEVLRGLPDLRLVATRTAGYSHIDVGAATERSVAVSIVPSASTAAVAEFTFGAVISLMRHLEPASRSTRAGRWEFTGFRGSELSGKVLGIVGLGAIGTQIAQLGLAFGMHVLAWSRREKSIVGVEQTTLDDVLTHSDVVSVNVALTPKTRRLLDARRLGLMKKTAILVNTARGDVVDEDALCDRLKSGEIAGACLDVLAIEPPGDAKLRQLHATPGLLLTPHIAWHTTESIERQFSSMTDNVLSFLAGKPQNLVATDSPS